MVLKEETIFTSSGMVIIDADCKKGNVLVLLKGNGENIIQMNGEPILKVPTGHSRIRFTKENFCLLNDKTLSFYSVAGEFVSSCQIGNDVFELFPYQDGVLCIYGDEGVYGKKLGKNRLNYAAPYQNPESYFDIAVQNNLLYDAHFARYKPFACLSWGINELLFLNEQLKRERTIEVPFETGNTIAFALTYDFGVFIEESKLWLWHFESSGQVSEYPGEFSYNTRAIYNRHEYMFLTVSDFEVQAFKPVFEGY